MQNGEKKLMPIGNRVAENVKWVYQDKIGYIFPAPTTIQLSNQTEKGSWADITDQKNISAEIISMDVFSLWINHGNSPDSASYQYIVVPDVTEQELIETSGNNRNIEIIANTSDVQAVMNKTLGICQIAFYRAGEVNISKGLTVKMESQGMAMLRMDGDKVLELTVSDPSRKLNKVLVTLSGTYKDKGQNFIALSDPGQNSTLIIVDLPQGVYAGMSITVELN